MKKKLLMWLLLIFSIGTAQAQSKIYVNAGATGANNGTSWTDAFTDFQTGVNAANATDEVWVAAGIYQPSSGSFFSMKEGVKIYGGFVGNESQLTQRQWSNNATILKGNGNSVIRNANNGLSAAAILDGFIITEGNSSDYGGGIYNDQASPILRNLIIHNNIGLSAAAIFNQQSSPFLLNVSITGNSATMRGAGMFNKTNSFPSIINCTIAANKTDMPPSGAIFNLDGSLPLIYNSIILGNNEGISGSINPSSANNLVQTGDENSGAGPANTSPADIFVSPITPGQSAAGDFRLKSNRASVNAGNNSHYAGLDGNSLDLDGNKRVYDYAGGGIIDLGAFEYQERLKVYVNAGATGANNGTSWTDAFTNFQTGINAANATDEVWVAAGTYQPSSGSFFSMKEGVKIYGGFVGNETQLAQRQWRNNATILKGNYNSVIRNENNGLSAAALLDGFIITNAFSPVEGGGIYNEQASPILRNLIIRNNYGNHGGGIFNKRSSPQVINTSITGNYAYGNGGGVYNLDNSAPTFINVTISANNANFYHWGDGMFNYDSSSPKLYNCIILGNYSAFTGSNSSIDPSSANNLIQTGNESSGAGPLGTKPTDIFVNPISPGQSAGGDFRLKNNRASVNAGNNSHYAGLDGNSLDLDGNSRVYDYAGGGTIDLGAFEYQERLKVYVNVGAIGANNGKSWDNAYTNFQNGVNAANFGDEVWVAAGTYQPSSGSFFSMKEGVKIYGGFVGNETQLTQRQWRNNATILKGNDNSVIRNENNGLSAAALLDGFIITEGSNSSGNGGGIYNELGNPSLSNLIIRNNQAELGGGIYNQQSSPLLLNISITGNIANGGGTAIYNNNNSSPTIINASIAANGTTTQATITNYSSSSPLLYNSIVLGNSGGVGGTIDGPLNASSANNLIQTGGASSDAGLPVTTPTDIFVGSLAPGKSAGGDYRLINNPESVNAGNNSHYAGLDGNSLDLDGNSRVYDYAGGGTIDLGAYEFQIISRIYVNAGATGANNGTSWIDAFTDFQTGINAANFGDEVWVAAGTYQPVSGSFFSMKNRVKIYGGFVGNETQLTQRQWRNNATILKGNNNSVIRNVNNGLNTAALLDGFIITEGNSSGNGGGIYNELGNPALSNLIIRNNQAELGGGIYNQQSSPLLINISITGNIVNGGGTAIYNNDNSSPTIINASIAANGTTTQATFANYSNSRPLLYNSIVLGNSGGVGGTIDGPLNASSANNLIQTGGASSDAGSLGTTPTDIFVGSLAPGKSAGGDYHLIYNTASVNAGNNSHYAGLDGNSLDLDGNSRVYDYAGGGTIDLGAYEFQGDVLPVRLLVFEATKQNGNARLYWATANESGNRSFELYRSADAKNYQKIGELLSSSTKTYVFTDSSPLVGKNYYRLLQTDLNGNRTELGVRMLSFGLTEQVLAYPNPSSGLVKLRYPSNSYVRMELIDATGRVLQHWVLDASGQQQFDLSTRAKGLYLIRLSGTAGTQQLKLIKE